MIIEFNTNLCENYNMIRSKMDHGKFRNYVQRGSFTLRSYVAAMYFNEGFTWIHEFLKSV